VSASRAAWQICSHFATVGAIGFSSNTCLPAAKAATAISAWLS